MKNDATDVGHRVVLLPQINRAEKLRTKRTLLFLLNPSSGGCRRDGILHSSFRYDSWGVYIHPEPPWVDSRFPLTFGTY